MTTLPSWAYVGAEVICVKTWSSKYPYHRKMIAGPVKDKKYTIREIGYFLPREPNTICVRLEELKNPVGVFDNGVYEPAFGLWRFQPVKRITLEQDMEIFAPLLNTQKENELV